MQSPGWAEHDKWLNIYLHELNNPILTSLFCVMSFILRYLRFLYVNIYNQFFFLFFIIFKRSRLANVHNDISKNFSLQNREK